MAMKVRRNTFTVTEEFLVREDRAPQAIQNAIAGEAGYMVKQILLQDGIEKGSPIYIDVPRKERDFLSATVEIELEIKYFPYIPPAPERPKITSGPVHGTPRVQRPEVKHPPINTQNRKELTDGRSE